MKCLVLLFALVLATEHNIKSTEEIPDQNSPILVKIEENEYDKKTTKISKYIGVSLNTSHERWVAQRWSRHEKKLVHNGYFKDEETAAHASDTLARRLIENGEQKHKLNFPGDTTEVYKEKLTTSKYQYSGMYYNLAIARWQVQRWSKNQKKVIYNGYYKDEETAAHASDTLARKLMANGEQKLKLNFQGDDIETYPAEKATTSKYIGVSYCRKKLRWIAQRRSKKEQKMVYNGYFKDEEKAAHASDTLARKLMANGEQNHKLNFPDDDTEVYAEKLRKNKRRRSHDLEMSGKVSDK